MQFWRKSFALSTYVMAWILIGFLRCNRKLWCTKKMQRIRQEWDNYCCLLSFGGQTCWTETAARNVPQWPWKQQPRNVHSDQILVCSFLSFDWALDWWTWLDRIYSRFPWFSPVRQKWFMSGFGSCLQVTNDAQRNRSRLFANVGQITNFHYDFETHFSLGFSICCWESCNCVGSFPSCCLRGLKGAKKGLVFDKWMLTLWPKKHFIASIKLAIPANQFSYDIYVERAMPHFLTPKTPMEWNGLKSNALSATESNEELLIYTL